MIWQGVPLGFDHRDDKPVSYDGNAPVLIFGPPGSNKTVGFVAAQLLDDDGSKPRSFIVIDPKGEVCAITSQYRRKLCGADNVKIINPYGLLVAERPDMKSDGWNPLGALDPDARGFGDACAAMGDALVKANSNDSQPIFANSARSAFTAGINFEVRDARAQGMTPSLANVRAMLTLETEQLVEVVKKMIAIGDPDITTRMRKFLNDNKEIQSIKSNIETDTAWMTQEMRDDMCVAGGVDFRACKQRATTIYIIVPTSELANKASYLRLAISTALRALYREGGVPVTLLVEEAFVIGHLGELEQACSILRGFDSRLVVVFQSLQQIKKLYPDTWGLFTAGAVLGFRPADLETAEWMTKRAGEEFVPSLSAADPSGANDLGARPSWGPQKRDRIPVARMFGMPQGVALVWLPNAEAPCIVRVKGYFELKALNARASLNPYFRGKGRSIRLRRGFGGQAGGRIIGVVAALGIAAVIAGFMLPRGSVVRTLQGFLPAGIARHFAAAPAPPAHAGASQRNSTPRLAARRAE